MKFVECDICDSSHPIELVPAHTIRTIQTRSGVIETTFGVVACSNCGFVFLSPRMDEKELAAYYEGQSCLHSQSVKGANAGEQGVESLQKDFIFSHVPGAIETVLEVGSAEGNFLSMFQSNGCSCFGIEPSTYYIEELVRRFGEDNIFPGRLEDLNGWEEAFDLVVMRHILEHLQSPVSGLRKVNALLKGGGHVYIEVPNLSRIYAAIYSYFINEHLSYFTPVSLENALKRSNFSVVFMEQFDGNPGASGKGYPVLRVIARKAPEMSIDIENDYANVTKAMDRYRKASSEFNETVVMPLQKRISAWAADGRRVAIFGAGPHTMELFVNTDIQKARCVAIFDNNRLKWGLDIFLEFLFATRKMWNRSDRTWCLYPVVNARVRS